MEILRHVIVCLLRIYFFSETLVVEVDFLKHMLGGHGIYLGMVSGSCLAQALLAGRFVPAGDFSLSLVSRYNGRALSGSGHTAHCCCPGGITASGHDSGRMPSASTRDHGRACS